MCLNRTVLIYRLKKMYFMSDSTFYISKWGVFIFFYSDLKNISHGILVAERLD
jgi:hypothetical protein